MKILLLGDTHGRLFQARLVIKEALKYHPEITAAIQVGDFGFYPDVFEDIKERSFCFPIPVYAIDGNHEHHKWLHKNKGKWNAWAQDHNIIFKERGDIMEIDNKTGSKINIGFVGGAMNVDRHQEGSIDKGTTNYLTWNQTETLLEKWNQNPIDIVIAHSCPHSRGVNMMGHPMFIPYIYEFINKPLGVEVGPVEDCGEEALNHVWDNLIQKPKNWIFGHFHKHHYNKVDDTEFWCINRGDHGWDGVIYIYDTLTGEVERERI